MQRKGNKTTRATNAQEQRWMIHVKQMDCCLCRASGPSICDHIFGSAKKQTFNFETVLVGSWFVLPLCVMCDAVKTLGSHRAFIDRFGKHQMGIWIDHFSEDPRVPEKIIQIAYQMPEAGWTKD